MYLIVIKLKKRNQAFRTDTPVRRAFILHAAYMAFIHSLTLSWSLPGMNAKV